MICFYWCPKCKDERIRDFNSLNEKCTTCGEYMHLKKCEDASVEEPYDNG